MGVLSTALPDRANHRTSRKASAADSTLKCDVEGSLALSSTVLGGRVKSSVLVNCRILDADIEGYGRECECVSAHGQVAWAYRSRAGGISVTCRGHVVVMCGHLGQFPTVLAGQY